MPSGTCYLGTTTAIEGMVATIPATPDEDDHNMAANDESSDVASIPSSNSPHSWYGCPNGRTNIQARDLKERIRLATAEAAKSYSIVRATARANNKPRAPKGELAQIVRTSKQKYGVDECPHKHRNCTYKSWTT
jgi:hypothetical protein